MDEQKIKSWLHLLNAPGLGHVRISGLLNHYSSAKKIIQQTQFPEELKIPPQAIKYIANATDEDIKKELLWLQQENNHLIALDDPLYPSLLKQSASPPVALFVKGDSKTLLLPQLAVVGSRNASKGGLANAKSFCADLAAGGLTITSGLAAGIDAMAHRAALEGGGKTIAVMGTGMNQIYPTVNKNLAKQIITHGAVVSEFPLNTPPHASNFPRRNRIISGLSLGTLVIEAGVKSGTLITARLTMENNRPVLAIPGSIHNPLSRGCHQLIKQGAKLVESADDILDELKPMAQYLSEELTSSLKKIEKQSVEKSSQNPNNGLTQSQQQVFDCIGYDPILLDDIVYASKLNIAEVSSIILILELNNHIQKLAGAKYQKL